MRKFSMLVAFCLSVCVTVPVAARSGMTQQRPNVIVILADDLGYGDVQCYNPVRGKIATPAIDQLATTGIRFTDAHSSSGVCSPSRYTLLTGRYHWRTRLQSGIVGYLEQPLISPARLTLGTLFQEHGYDTACIGKWHLGWDWGISKEQKPLFAPKKGETDVTAEHLQAWQDLFSKPIAGGPTTRGFTNYFGTDVPNWPPYCYIEDDRTIGIPSTFLPERLIGNNLASVPGPALKEWSLEAILPELTRRACHFIEKEAENEKPFFLYLPLTSPHTPLAVNEPWRGKSGLGSAVADLVMETDATVGAVLDTLKRVGADKNTIIVFTSDNGFAPYTGAKELEAQGHYPSGPFRGYKGDAWEGGHRVPMIVSWPGVVPKGAVSEALVHHADLMATFAEVLGFDLPENAGEDSFSLWPILSGKAAEVREHAVSQGSQGMPALRMGQWKLLFGPSGGGAWSKLSADPDSKSPLQLYNLALDPSERENLANVESQRVKEMIDTMQTLVRQGRSTPGESQRNDVAVQWRKFLPKSSTDDPKD